MNHIIFLHGALGSSDQLQPLIELYKAYDHYSACHSFDFAGHGKNASINNNENEFSIQQFSNDLLKYISSLSHGTDENIFIFGYSMGGYAALYLAKTHPDSIDKIFTLGTKFDWNKEAARKESAMLDADKIEEKIPNFAGSLKERHGSEGWKDVLKNTASMMLGLGNDPLLKEDDLKQIKCEVKIAVGEKDNMVTFEESQQAAESLLNGSLLVLENTLHPIEKVNYEKLCSELIKFFKS